MNRRIFILIMIFTAIYFLMIDYSHKCKWPLCPYKGIEEHQWERAVMNYVGEEGTDAYYIDMLHLEFPDLEYDDLENLLFNQKFKPS